MEVRCCLECNDQLFRLLDIARAVIHNPYADPDARTNCRLEAVDYVRALESPCG